VTEAVDLLKKVRRLEIRSRRLVQDILAGGSESVFKGRGIEFEEVRPYVPGDEVRDIDWNVTARLGSPYVKRFVEERELTVMLVVDISRSMRFGTAGSEKRELAAELCAVLGFAAMRNNDRVGLILAAERVEHFVPPARGKTHLLRMLRDVLLVTPSGAGTRLGEAAKFVMRSSRRRALVFWLSDFEDRLDLRDWQVMGRRHEVTAMALRDPRDEALPAVGWVEFEDLESGRRGLVNTSSPKVRSAYQREALARRHAAEHVLRRARCPLLPLHVDRPWMPVLMRYFATRSRGREGTVA
jgi:uncharacterized protein (DUF58 family)